MENPNSRHNNQNPRTMQITKTILRHHEIKNSHHRKCNTGIAYGFYILPFSIPTIQKLDKLLIRLQKSICGLSNSTPNVTTQLTHNLFGLNAFSLTQTYIRCIGEQLRDAPNDPGIISIIYQGLTNYTFFLYDRSKNPKISPTACVHSPTTCTIYLLKTLERMYIRKYMDGSYRNTTPLESKWLAQRLLHPHIIVKTSLQYIHKLPDNTCYKK